MSTATPPADTPADLALQNSARGLRTWKQLEDAGLANEIEETYREDVCGIDFEDAKEHLENDEGYLFRCLHCGKHYIYIDFD